MRLLLLRHAKAEKFAPEGHDRDRPLNGRGHRDAALIGAYMARHALSPDRVLVSSAQRTRETWSDLAQALRGSTSASFIDRLYNADAKAIMEIIRAAGGRAASLLVVGHNPGMHEAARTLIAAGPIDARERLNESLPTSGLAVIDFPGPDWQALHGHGGRLERFVTPRLLRAETD